MTVSCRKRLIFDQIGYCARRGVIVGAALCGRPRVETGDYRERAAREGRPLQFAFASPRFSGGPAIGGWSGAVLLSEVVDEVSV